MVIQSLSHVRLFATLWTAACQASLSITNSRACSYSCPLSWWCHPTISSSVIPFSSRLQSFPVSVLQVNTQDWSPLGWTGWISLQSRGLSRVFNTTEQKHGDYLTLICVIVEQKSVLQAFFFCIDVSLIGSLHSTLYFNDGKESSENNLNTRQIVITKMMGGVVSMLKTPSFLACWLLTGQLSFIHSLYFSHLVKKDDGNHLGKACLNVSLKWSWYPKWQKKY